jgi:hypothetical protein
VAHKQSLNSSLQFHSSFTEKSDDSRPSKGIVPIVEELDNDNPTPTQSGQPLGLNLIKKIEQGVMNRVL